MLTIRKGITFIELLIGLALGSFVMAAILGLYVHLAGTSRSLVTQSVMQYELDSVLGTMTRDIRRAGYWQFGDPASAPHNPFVDTGTDLHTGRYDPSTPADSCLTYAYDLNRDGQFSHGNNELFGFRLRDDAIEIRTGGSGVGCATGSWQRITPASVLIRQLTFSIERQWLEPSVAGGACPDAACQSVRRVHIVIAASPADHPGATMNLSTTVLVRNNRIDT